MATAYRIIHWAEAHSSSYTARQKSLQWIACTTADPSPALGWLQSQGMKGMAAVGVYVRLAEFAGRLPIRGLLADRARPYEAAELAVLLHVPLPVVRSALKLLTAKQRDDSHPWHPYIDRVPFPVPDELVDTFTDRSGVVSRTIRAEPRGPDDAQSSVAPPSNRQLRDGAAKPCAHTDTDTDTDSNRSIPRGERVSPNSSSSPTDEAGEREHARHRWVQHSVVFLVPAGADDRRLRIEATSMGRLFDDLIWPDDDSISDDDGAKRTCEALDLLDKSRRAIGVKNKSAWLTECVKQHFAEQQEGSAA